MCTIQRVEVVFSRIIYITACAINCCIVMFHYKFPQCEHKRNTPSEIKSIAQKGDKDFLAYANLESASCVGFAKSSKLLTLIKAIIHKSSAHSQYAPHVTWDPCHPVERLHGRLMDRNHVVLKQTFVVLILTRLFLWVVHRSWRCVLSLPHQHERCERGRALSPPVPSLGGTCSLDPRWKYTVQGANPPLPLPSPFLPRVSITVSLHLSLALAGRSFLMLTHRVKHTCELKWSKWHTQPTNSHMFHAELCKHAADKHRFPSIIHFHNFLSNSEHNTWNHGASCMIDGVNYRRMMFRSLSQGR